MSTAMRRKILTGVLALALPLGTVAATQTAASAAGFIGPNVGCSFQDSTMTITPGTAISAQGTATSAKTSQTGT